MTTEYDESVDINSRDDIVEKVCCLYWCGGYPRHADRGVGAFRPVFVSTTLPSDVPPILR